MQFKEAVWILSGFISAGLSVENAFEGTLMEVQKLYGRNAMIAAEFRQILNGLRLNKPVEGLLEDFARRSTLPDIQSFAEVFSIARKTGGSMREIMERTTGVIRDRAQVQEEIKNMTASRRYEQNVMSLIPFGLILYMQLSSPGFLDVMYETLKGRAVMTLAVLLLLASRLLADDILEIEV